MRAEHGAYLKVQIFDRFDGISWHKSQSSDVKRKLRLGEITLLENVTPNFRQNISIEVNLGAYLPAAAIPVDLAFPATVISLDPYQMIKIPSALHKGTNYTVDSSVRFAHGRLLAGDRHRPRDSDLQLPGNFDARVRGLAERISEGAPTALEKANRLEEHLRENYEYSFASVFHSQNRTPVGRFLFEDKKGHCEYFASAMAVMLRSVGIPARLVTGFSATVANPLTGYYEIRALDGHAWVEAWVDDLGWVLYEPTPAYHLPEPEQKMTSAERIQEYVDRLEQMQTQYGAEGELSLQNILTSIWQSLSVMVVALVSYIKLAIVSGWKWLITAAAAVIVIVLLWQQWKPYLLKRLIYLKVLAYKPGDRKSAVRFYMKQIQEVMNINGKARRPGTTIEQYMAQLNQLKELNQASEESEVMRKAISLVNQTHYATDSDLSLDPALLKWVFFSLYKAS
jgi:hypothetical protein